MRKPVVIFGNGELAAQVFRVNEFEKNIPIKAVSADRDFIRSDTFMGLPLVPFESVETDYPPEEFDMLLCIGYKRMRQRRLMAERALKKKYTLVNFISQRAILYPPSKLGCNNIVFGGVYIGSDHTLGNNNVIRPNVYIGHGTVMGDHSYIAPGVRIGGSCIIHDLCFFGIGSTVIDRLNVADETCAGAGTLIIKNTDPCTKYLGVPAVKFGMHTETGIEIKEG